jgi:hypothetical protein
VSLADISIAALALRADKTEMQTAAIETMTNFEGATIFIYIIRQNITA